MDGLVSLSGVGAVASSIQLQAAYQAKSLKIQNDVARDLSASALKLIQASVIPVPSGVGNDLDVSG